MKAFPNKPTFDLDTGKTITHDGMDLRDYFAAKAMQKLLNETANIYEVSERAYIMADEMMLAIEDKSNDENE
jgi:hypothetical protein